MTTVPGDRSSIDPILDAVTVNAVNVINAVQKVYKFEVTLSSIHSCLMDRTAELALQKTWLQVSIV